jgi:hypothetical protein
MKHLFIIILTASGLQLFGQSLPLEKELFSIHHNADHFTTDQLGNVFLWNENFIWMYTNTGDSLAAFNSRKYGAISHVDATNPYEILVFFSDYNLILFLDNYLSNNGKEIDLQSHGYDQISNACKSRANGIWIYDAIQQRAIHLDNSYKKDKETLNLSQWFNERVTPSQLLEFNNQLFIGSPQAVYVFDHFGTFKKKIPLVNVNDFQLVNEELRYMRDSVFCSYSPKDFKETCRTILLPDIENVRIEKNRFYVLQPKKLMVFSTN